MIKNFPPGRIPEKRLHFSGQFKTTIINKTAKKDLRGFSFWFNVNKITINTVKTEFILFKTSNKDDDADLKIKFCRKRVNASRMLNISSILSAFFDSALQREL